MASYGLEKAKEAVGGDFEAGNVIADTFFGGAIQGGSDLVKARKAATAQKASELAGTANFTPTEELVKSAREKNPDLDALATKIGVDEGALKDAEDLDLDISVAALAKNPRFKGTLSTLASRKGSVLHDEHLDNIQKVSEKTEAFIEEMGGRIRDKTGIDEKITAKVKGNIEELKGEEKKVYKIIEEGVPENTQVDMKSIAKHLEARVKRLGGEKYLSPLEKRLLDMSKARPKPPVEDPLAKRLSPLLGSRKPQAEPTPKYQTQNYGLVDELREDIGQSIGKIKGPYGKFSDRNLKRAYAWLSEAQEGSLANTPFLKDWEKAKELGRQRGKLQQESVQLLGKELSGAIMPRLEREARLLSKGEFEKFDRIVAQIPTDLRQEAVVSALNETMRTKSGHFSPIQFDNWYREVANNKSILNRIERYLPEGGAERLRKLANVSRALGDVERTKERTGLVTVALDNFDKANGFFSKIYQNHKGKIDAFTQLPILGSAATPINIVVQLASAGKSNIIDAADELLTSKEMMDVIKGMKGGKTRAGQARQAAAEKQLRKSKKYQRWVDALSTEERRALLRVGTTEYLFGGEDD